MLTGFADEISTDLEEQLRNVKELGFRYIELRNVWGKNVLQLSDEEVEKAIALLQLYECHISSIASPLGKYSIQEDFEPQLHSAIRAIELAQKFDAKYIRVFSYYIPNGGNPLDYREEVIRRMTALSNLAEKSNITLVLENDSGGLYADVDERVYDVVSSIASPFLRLAFDPGNFVMEGLEPMEAYERLAPYIDYIHIKDADASARIFVEAGRGSGELSTLIRKLKDCSFKGFLSIEPHLHKAYPEIDNLERFTIAANALKEMLVDQSATWNQPNVNINRR